jgi:cytochrome o ubiquinol oxidase operon protein cyoD
MSTELHTTKEQEHGTTKSYVIGFILSLIFTIIPYHLVVNKVISGDALLATILGIAVLQMAIQLLFFLHLGRGPKPLYNVVFFFATAGIIILTVGASIFIMNNLYRNMLPEEVTKKLAQEEGISQIGGEETGACNELRNNHIVTILEGVINPVRTQAELCDTLTIINKDGFKRQITFGSHPAHGSYGGEYELFVGSDPETITLNETGDFIFHDHLDPDVVGYFSVEL